MEVMTKLRAVKLGKAYPVVVLMTVESLNYS